MKTPALFIGHGNPMNVLEPDNIFNQGIRAVAAKLPKPKAILCISAHWFEPVAEVGSGENPELIYDFYGFPQELYEVQYPAKGSPELAKIIQELAIDEHIQLNPHRGYDHGMWTVLKHLYPDADVPVVQLSLDSRKSPREHFALAQKLAVLREQGVMIVGSGDIVHNLRLMDRANVDTLNIAYDWADEFRLHINKAIETQDVSALVDFAAYGRPAELSIPTPEHYLPLLYVMAARDANDQIDLFNDYMVGGSLSMTSVLLS
ncbi:MAG: 4,5-DOPA dioxygenase extradiol [Neisseria sp.]|nr:4,5-DOPA dioxygenase extradiol [Neisseria sp.]